MNGSTVCRTPTQPKGNSNIYGNSNLPKSNNHSPWIQFPSNIVNLAVALKKSVISSSPSSGSSSSSSTTANNLTTNINNTTYKGSRFKKSNILKIKSANPLRYSTAQNETNIMKKIISDSRKRSQSLTTNFDSKPKLEIPTLTKEMPANGRKDSSIHSGVLGQQVGGHLKPSSKESSSTTTPTTPTPTNNGRRNSTQGQILNPLAKSRIKHCLRNTPPKFGHLIMRRMCQQRPEIRNFIQNLSEDCVNELSNSVAEFLFATVENIDDLPTIQRLATEFGESYVQYVYSGFRPEFFSQIADTYIAESLKLDGGGMHKRCEALLAWSQFMQLIFTNVRDGYYGKLRAQRRSSLPANKLYATKVG
uniref:Globin family profile domain-containing protein n=1 Tax=Strongyloides venezuelensis TaxID=75913 RepID=A0A0K0FI93_STRVS